MELVTTMQAVYIGSSLLGALLHWAKKAYNQEANKNPLVYFLKDHPNRSAAVGVGLAASAWTAAFGTDMIADMDPVSVFSMAFLNGWTVDSLLNKGKMQAPAPANRKGKK